MERSEVASDVDSSVPEQPQAAAPHVVILHERLIKRKTDRYIINLALAFSKIGHKVTIYTSQFDKNDSIADIAFTDYVDVQHSAWWIPRSIFGVFRNNMSALKAAWMALGVIFSPPNPKPEVFVLDLSKCALYLLSVFTEHKLYYVESFMELKNTDACYEHSKIYPSLLEAKWIKLADEIIVETVGFAEILKKSYPSLQRQPQILYPSIDLGVWNEPGIKVQRIIPDLLNNTILFLTIGKFRRSSNFRLALDAFEMLLELIDDKSVTKRFHLVIAGHCKTLDEKFYYNEVMAVAKEKLCGSQVTFLKQLPIIHEKTLIMESALMVHPAKNDVHSDFLLKAMSLGKPIVATNKGIASKMLIHRLSGVIIEPDAKMFAVAMKKLMMSPHLQVFLGDMAKDVFEKQYSFDSLCDKMDKLIQKPAGCNSKSIVSNGQFL